MTADHHDRELWERYFKPCKGLIPRALFLGEMRNISPVSFEL
jgi:hypothetical protein